MPQKDADVSGAGCIQRTSGKKMHVLLRLDLTLLCIIMSCMCHRRENQSENTSEYYTAVLSSKSMC